MHNRFWPGTSWKLLTTLIAAVSLIAAAYMPPKPSSAAGTLVTPEGVTINVYTDQVTPQQVYQTLLDNGLQAHIKLVRVDVVESGLNMASVGADCMILADGARQCVPASAVIQLNVNSLLAYPNIIVGHEYGHVWENFYRWTYWDGSFDAYLEARGLTGDSRLGSSHCWQPYEILAEDYRLLFGAPHESTGQCNRYIPTPDQVPGLEEFLALTWTNGNPPPNYNGGSVTESSTEPTPTATPSPTPSPSPTATPSPTPTATATATPTPTPTASADGSTSVSVFVPKGWNSFVAPLSGMTDVTVYLSKGTRWPTHSVIKGQVYWAKGPVTITITAD